MNPALLLFLFVFHTGLQKGPALQIIKDYGLKHYVHLNRSLPRKENHTWKLVCEMPHNCQFQPWIKVVANTGSRIKFNSSNPVVQFLVPTETCSTQAGDHAYLASKWISGRGAIYTIPPGVTVQSVQYLETGFNTRIVGAFNCDYSDYNTLWRRAARTAYICMRRHYFDCPDRERTEFWGDGTIDLENSFYIFDSRAHFLAKHLVLKPLAPKFYPGQILEFLGRYGLWFYFMQTGDLSTLDKVYNATKKFLLHTYKFGNPHTWYDWGSSHIDTAVIEQCFEYIDLKSLRKIAIVTHHMQDLPRIDTQLKRIKYSFNATYWKSGFYQSKDVTAPDDRANAIAVDSGLASPAKYNAIYNNVLKRTTNASCFFDRWVFEALCKMNRPDKALHRMAHRYRHEIKSSFSTLWEHYDRWWGAWFNAFDENSTLNHGWNPPAILLSRYIAGVQPVTPGWKTFDVLPQEAFLNTIKVTVPTNLGLIDVHIHKTRTQYKISINAPSGTKAIVGIPLRSFSRLDSVDLDNQLIWNQKSIPNKNVDCLGKINGYLSFLVKAGKHIFLAHGTLPIKAVPSPRPTYSQTIVLKRRNWTATSSVKDGSYDLRTTRISVDASADNALDGDHWTGWRDMTAKQHPGQWFQVDMKHQQTFNEIDLHNTWAMYDSPKKYEIMVSNDGRNWKGPVTTGSGHLGITHIHFHMQKARFIRIIQVGSSSKYHWSIYELNVLRNTR